MGKTWLLIGSIMGFLSVAGGAFGAHALKARVSTEMIEVFTTGTRYLMLHAVALLAVGVLADRMAGTSLSVAGWTFTVGTLIFTGSLWVLAGTGTRWLGAITPIGGLTLLVGWAALAMAVAKSGPA
jgi:uncharacterized membrane protein YgdD (TMEM256/DUF423 family)